MSSNKDFKKRRREEEMDDREQKRRRSDQEDRRSRSYHNSRSADQNRHNNNYNNRNRRAHNYSNNGNPSNNYTNRNNNSAHSTKYNQPQYRIKENSDNNRILEKKPKRKSPSTFLAIAQSWKQIITILCTLILNIIILIIKSKYRRVCKNPKCQIHPHHWQRILHLPFRAITTTPTSIDILSYLHRVRWCTRSIKRYWRR